jgi:hypothetical protein
VLKVTGHQEGASRRKTVILGLVRDQIHPDHVRGLGERQTALHEEMIGPITELRDCENFLWPHHLVENIREESPDPSLGPQPHVPQLFRASSEVSLGEERGLEYPAGLTIDSGLQIALDTHRSQAGRTSSNRPGVETPDYPPPTYHRPVGVPRIGLSASLFGRAAYSAPSSGPCVRSGRICRSYGALCAVLPMEF